MDIEWLCQGGQLSCWAIDFLSPPPKPETACARSFLGMCLVIPEASTAKIFGFAEFVQAFALLVVVYTVSDVRYRFRIITAPIPLQVITFWVSGLVGLGALFSDFWFSKSYPLPFFLANQSIWQVVLGLSFLGVVLVWLWYAFIRPPLYSRYNCTRFGRALYYYLLQGVEADLPTIASELQRSAKSIIYHARERPGYGPQRPPKKLEQVANDIILLIALRKFCRHIAASAPATAIAFFRAMSEQQKYDLPIGQFASNMSTEALMNKDSILYHEDEGYYSGYFGYVRPLTNALYGDFKLVEGLTRGNSPLDINLYIRWNFDAKQLEAYARAVLTTFKSYLTTGRFPVHSYALYRALEVLKGATSDLYKLNSEPQPPNANDIEDRLSVVVGFVNDAIKALHEHGVQETTLRQRGAKHTWNNDFYDHLAKLMFEVIENAANVKTREFVSWQVHHNAVWSQFFNYDDSPTRKIILFKLRRLLYEEVRELDAVPHFRNAATVGLMLNVFGFTQIGRRDYREEQFALRRVVIDWAERRYHWVVRRQPRAAQAVLIGSLSYDKKNRRLVKTYQQGLRLRAPTDQLQVWEAIGPLKPTYD